MRFWRAISAKLHIVIKKPENMLKNSLLSFRIWKQNFKIRFGLKVINVQRKHLFWTKIDIFWHFFADVIINNDFLKLFLTNLCSLHGKEYVCQISCKNKHFSRKYGGGGHNAPPPIRGEPPKSPSWIGLKKRYLWSGIIFFFSCIMLEETVLVLVLKTRLKTFFF